MIIHKGLLCKLDDTFMTSFSDMLQSCPSRYSCHGFYPESNSVIELESEQSEDSEEKVWLSTLALHPPELVGQLNTDHHTQAEDKNLMHVTGIWNALLFAQSYKLDIRDCYGSSYNQVKGNKCKCECCSN